METPASRLRTCSHHAVFAAKHHHVQHDLVVSICWSIEVVLQAAEKVTVLGVSAEDEVDLHLRERGVCSGEMQVFHPTPGRGRRLDYMSHLAREQGHKPSVARCTCISDVHLRSLDRQSAFRLVHSVALEYIADWMCVNVGSVPTCARVTYKYHAQASCLAHTVEPKRSW